MGHTQIILIMRWRSLKAPVAASVLVSMAMLAVIFTANDSALIRESSSRSFSSKDEQAIKAAAAAPVDCRLVDHRGYWQMGHGAECCRHHFVEAAKQCKATQQSCEHLRDEDSDPQACNERVHDHCNEQKMEESGFFHEDDQTTSPIDYLLAHPSEMKPITESQKKKTNRKKKHIQQKEKKSADLAEAEEKKVVGQQVENEEKKATETELLQSLPLGRRLKHDKKMSAKKELAKKQKLKHVVTKPKATKDRMAVSTSPFIRCYAAGIRHCRAQLKPSKVKALLGCMQLSSARTNQCFSAARTTRDACITKSRLDD